MRVELYEKLLSDTLMQVKNTLDVKAKEYRRENNPMHNFDEGARITGQTREQVIYGFALKHHISIADLRKDVEKGDLPTAEVINEKYNDAINYLILEKISMLEKVSKRNNDRFKQ